MMEKRSATAEKMRNTSTGWHSSPISSRLISIRISARPRNITIIQVYAPTSDHEDEEVEQFCGQLHGITAKTPEKDILVVQGVWNAKVGPDEC